MVPPEAQWFANLDSAQTRRAYQNDLRAFMAFTGINQPQEFRSVTRGHVLAWRADLEKQGLAGATIRPAGKIRVKTCHIAFRSESGAWDRGCLALLCFAVQSLWASYDNHLCACNLSRAT